MKQFKDAAGRTWKISLDFVKMSRLKSELGIDLLDFAGDTYEMLANDPGVYGSVFFVLLQDQLAEQMDEPSLDEFARGFRGETWEIAFSTLMDELVVFLPPRKAKVLKTLIQKFRQADILATTNALEEVRKLDVTKVVQRTLGTSQTS